MLFDNVYDTGSAHLSAYFNTCNLDSLKKASVIVDIDVRNTNTPYTHTLEYICTSEESDGTRKHDKVKAERKTHTLFLYIEHLVLNGHR